MGEGVTQILITEERVEKVCVKGHIQSKQWDLVEMEELRWHELLSPGVRFTHSNDVCRLQITIPNQHQWPSELGFGTSYFHKLSKIIFFCSR